MNDRIQAELTKKFRKATNKLLLLDYDGTLVNYAMIPGNAVPTEYLENVLLKLIEIPHTKTIIISGRGQQEIDKLLGHLPINIIAEHGALVKEKGSWEKQINDNCLWKNEVMPVLDEITLRCPESYIEEKCFSLAWHYRNSETLLGYAHSRELLRLTEKFTSSHNLKVLDGNKVVEIMTREVGKGSAVKKLIEHDVYDFILAIGDDATDEEIFELFLYESNSYTIKVGNGNTSARYKFESVGDVVLFLKHLSE